MIAAELRYSMMDLMAAALGNATFADGEWRVEGVSVGVMASKGLPFVLGERVRAYRTFHSLNVWLSDAFS